METTAHYTRVGIFVVIFTVCLVIGILWLSVGLSGKSYSDYMVYMHESVSGLTIKAPVKYNGVEIGYVSDIDLYKKDPRKVRLILSIQETTPIYKGTQAVLETQGLTGIAYIELKGGDLAQGLIVSSERGKLPVIPSAPSLLFRLDNALDNLTTNIQEISANLKSFLNPQNASAVQNTLSNFSLISNDLRQNSLKLDKLMDNAQITLENTAKASEQLPQVMDNIQQSAKSIQQFSNKADIILQNGSTAVQNFNSQLMPQAISAMTNIQNILNNLNDVSQQLAQDPAVLIRGKQAAPAGPGE